MPHGRYSRRDGRYSTPSTYAPLTASKSSSSGKTPTTTTGRPTASASRSIPGHHSHRRCKTYSRKSLTTSGDPCRPMATSRDGHDRACCCSTPHVRAHQAGSHQGKGWEQFTDAVIHELSAHRDHLVFMLWGSYAKAKGAQIDTSRHCILTAAHPSPLSAYRGFFGCHHFSLANAYLTSHGLTPIDW